VLGTAIDFIALIHPMFDYYVPDVVTWDFGNHVALVAGAIDTWQTTHAVPISSDQLVPGTEYPYFLFGNAGFYVLASFIGWTLGLSATPATAFTLVLGLFVGQLGTYLLARSFQLNRPYSVALGVLYATGPYLCVNLLVRADFPEFLVWQFLPLLCFLGRRAMRPNANFLWLMALGALLAFSMYVHKLVGPHIILFIFVLIAVNVCPSFGWWTRVFVLAVSVPCLAVFAWLPVLSAGDQILAFQRGSQGQIQIVNDLLSNFLWPWLQNSLPVSLDQPVYRNRFGLQLGLLATVGLAYGAWQLMRVRFRPRNRELFVAVIGGVVYSALVLGYDGIVDQLPFPLNAIQFSYRLIGLAFFAGLLALIAGLAEDNGSGEVHRDWRAHTLPIIAGLVVAASTISYWSPPGLTTVPLANLSAASLVDQGAFYPPTVRSLFSTSGAIGLDGSLSRRPWPILLGAGVEHAIAGQHGLLPTDATARWPSTVYLKAALPAADFTQPDTSIDVRVYALQTLTSVACAIDAEVSDARADLISALVALCDQKQVPAAARSVEMYGGTWRPTLLAERTYASPGMLETAIAIPQDVYFVAIECAPTVAEPALASTCLTVHYFGQANQLDHTAQVPLPFPSEVLSRGPFGQWTIRASNVTSGDYMLPTFDYPFVQVTDQNSSPVPTYQFNSHLVVRTDGQPHTYFVSYDLRRELKVLAAWAGLLALVPISYILLRWRLRERQFA
jgi:hypothetical protein